jgi:hypothetical protein
VFRKEVVEYVSRAPHGRVRWQQALVANQLAWGAALSALFGLFLALTISVTPPQVQARMRWLDAVSLMESSPGRTPTAARLSEAPLCGDPHGPAVIQMAMSRRSAKVLRVGDEISVSFNDETRVAPFMYDAQVLQFPTAAHIASGIFGSEMLHEIPAAAIVVIEATVHNVAKCHRKAAKTVDGQQFVALRITTPPQCLGKWLVRRLPSPLWRM